MPVPVRLAARKPELTALEGDSLGAHLKRRRRELGLRRIDAAAQMGCTWKSLMWWERDEREPVVNLYPAVIQFLGYEPWPEPTTLAEALIVERRRRGLPIDQMAAVIGVDAGSWGRWERGEAKLLGRATEAVSALLGYSVGERFPEAVRCRKRLSLAPLGLGSGAT